MTFIIRLIALYTIVAGVCLAQPQETPEELKLAMLEALITAPAERSLPIVSRILRDSESSLELQERALFVLGHIDTEEAESLLIEAAQSSDRRLRDEAIRSIGISGSDLALDALADIYRDGDNDARESVLEAYLISGNAQAAYELALTAKTEEEFSSVVETLGAMEALDELRALRASTEWTESLVDAYTIAGDTATLEEMARNATDPEQQIRAINGLAVAAGDEAAETVLEIYRASNDPDVRDAALEALMISNADEQVLALFRSSTDAKEQRRLLELLVIMDSDVAWDIIDSALQD